MDWEQEIRRCQSTPEWFCRQHLRIPPRDSNEQSIPWIWNPYQRDLQAQLPFARRIFPLKARKLGFTTQAMGAIGLHRCLFQAGYKAALVESDDNVAMDKFAQVRGWVASLPEPLSMGPLKVVESNAHKIKWAHGSEFIAFSAGTERLRSGDIDLVIFDEFAKYTDPLSQIAATEGAARKQAQMLYITTARGYGYTWELWRGSNGIRKIFYPWMQDTGYTLTEAELRYAVEDANVAEWPEDVAEYADTWGLSDGQARWVWGKLAGMHWNWKKFHQEFPASADLAFQGAEGRVFERVFQTSANPPAGWLRVLEASDIAAHAIGVDVASGAPTGDYSAIAALRVPDALRAVRSQMAALAATWRGRCSPTELGVLIAQMYDEYRGLVCVERNSYGLSVIEWLLAHRPDIPQWRDPRYDAKPGAEGRHAALNYGYWTDPGSRADAIERLRRWIDVAKAEIRCPRLQQEIQDFSYDDDGRPDHLPGMHDDLLFASGFALAAVDQVVPGRYVRQLPRLLTAREQRHFRAVTGVAYDPAKALDPDYRDAVDVIKQTLGRPENRPNKRLGSRSRTGAW